MCGLCGVFGVFGGEDHWSTGAGTAAAEPAIRRRERAHRLKLVNRVLARRRLQVTDFQGSAYVLASATGQQQIVHDLGAIWAAAQAMSKGALDPLDPGLLELPIGS